MNRINVVLLAVVLICLFTAFAVAETEKPAPDKDALMKALQQMLSEKDAASKSVIVVVDDSKKFQEIDGFGASFTDSSAWLIQEFLTDAEKRNEIMDKLFDPEKGIGISYIRQPMGTSDMRRIQDHSYDDVPKGQTDFELEHFSIAKDENYIIPVLKHAVALNPNIKFMGSPWSSPPWMKDSEDFKGGWLKNDDKVYGTYANYFVKYIKAYAKHGIDIDAVTLQNEPALEIGYPSLRMSPEDQIRFTRHLGRAFRKNKIDTKIAIYDHNWDYDEFPITVLKKAGKEEMSYIDGVAWHHYGGRPTSQTKIHDMFPDKNVYFTEGSLGTWQKFDDAGSLLYTANLIIRTTRNWAKCVVTWNMVLHWPPDDGPIVPGFKGCWTCYAVVMIDKDTKEISYRPQYYGLGHATKFTKPGAVRIFSSNTPKTGIKNVAFENKDDSIVCLVTNSNETAKDVKISFKGKSFAYAMPAKSVVTFIWNKKADTAQVWLTTGDKKHLLEKQEDIKFTK